MVRSFKTRNPKPRTKNYFWIGLFLVLVTLGCSGSGEKGRGRTGIEKGGCVSLVPSITEIIYAIGADSLLKGNTAQCDYPLAAQRVYKVGDFQAPDLERIVALKPGVVFATRPVHNQLIARLKELKVRVYVSEPKDIEGVFAEMESVGVLLNREEQAKRLVESLKTRLESLPVFSDTPRVYVEIAIQPLMSIGKGVFINDIICRAGGRNIFGDFPNPYPIVSPEMVAARNPDVILILHPGVKAGEVKQRVGWENIRAVKNGRIYAELDEDLFFRPGPRVVDGVLLLARLLHQ